MRHLINRFTAWTFCSLIFAGALIVGAGPAIAGELKLAHFMSPKHPMDRFIMRPWSKDLAKQSGGGLTVRIYPGGALGKGPVQQFKRAVDGIADITFGLQGFTSNLFPRTGLIELPGMAKNAAVAADKLWDAFSQLAPEYKRVKVLALWTNESQVLMTRDKPIRSVADMKGLKFRVPSKTQSKAIKALGGVPVFMPINRVYNALNTGVIDGVMTGPSTVLSFKFHEVAKYFTIGLPIGRSPFFLVMNKNTWNGLSAKDKALIDKTTGRALSVKASKFYMKAGAKGLGVVRKSKKHEVIRFSAAEMAKAKALLQASRAKTVADVQGKGIPADAILKAMGASGG
jgi:TRAP-type C4-dicarboxylate transport system substrate-binding protein